MPFPSFRDMLDPLLRVLSDAPEGLLVRRAQDLVADRLGLTLEERELRVPNGTQFLFRHRVNWAHDRLKRSQLSMTPRRGVWQLTSKGADLVRNHPHSLQPDEIRALSRAGHDVRLERCASMMNPQ